MADPLKAPAAGDFGEEKEPDEVPEWFLRYLHASLKRPLFSVPKPFETWMIDKVASSGFDLPISQVIGFSQFTVQPAALILTNETTTSGTFTDLATVGPTITGLPDGNYLILFGAFVHNTTAGCGARCAVKVNATEASTDDLAQVFADSTSGYPNGGVSVMRAIVKTLAGGGGNTLTMRYDRSTGGTASFSNRWMYALKYSNV